MKTLFHALLILSLVALCTSGAMAGEEVPVSELPAAVKQAIEEALPGSTLLRAEKDTDDGQTYYEVYARTKDGKTKEIYVTPGGKILEIDDD